MPPRRGRGRPGAPAREASPTKAPASPEKGAEDESDDDGDAFLTSVPTPGWLASFTP